MKLFLLSSNQKKIDEVKKCLSIPVHVENFDVSEIQGSVEEIIQHKLQIAREMFENKHLNDGNSKLRPDEYVLVMDDTCFHMNGLYGWPGAYAKDFLTLGFDKIVDIANKVGKGAEAITRLGVYYNKQVLIFEGSVKGEIGPAVSEKFSKYFDSIFFYDGKRVSEMTVEEKNQISARGKACRALEEFLRKEGLIDQFC